jgi:hypothetical protein
MATRIVIAAVAAGLALAHPGARDWLGSRAQAVVDAPSTRRTTARVESATRLLEREAAAGRSIPRTDAELHDLLLRHENSEVGPHDAWGTALFLKRHGFRVQLGSAGPDRIRGTEDDILAPPLRTTHR